MEFAAFAARAREIEAESADIAIVEHVTELLTAAGADLPVVTRFVQGRVFPAWSSRTLDIGPSACYEAIARAAGPNVSAADIEERLAEIGEIGAVAAGFDLDGQAGLAAFGAGQEPLTVGEVEEELSALAADEGEGSHDRKVDRLFGLFSRSDPDEARYLARLVLSEMRIGVGEGTVRDTIAEAFGLPIDEVERALQVSNDYGLVAEVARDEGEDGIAEITLAVGRPIQPMLAQAGTVTEAVDAWETVAVQWKYDGARVQLHYDGEKARLFSRNMEEVTDALPEVVEFADEHLDHPVILDGEVVAVDDRGEPRPFQEVLRRFRRKYEVDRLREEVPVEPVFFDCLHVGVTSPSGETDGAVDLLDAPLTERYAALSDLLDDGISELWITDDPGRIEAIESEALASGHEGIMLKNPAATYTPGRRGREWRKRKPDVETLDLVVTGAEWGEGRRATYLGTFEVSVRVADDDGRSGGYATVGKVATGITDEELAALTELLEPHVLVEDGREVRIEPAVVFEVGYEEIQRSPTYDSGYALRFPRFLSVRDDLDPADADSAERIERLAKR